MTVSKLASSTANAAGIPGLDRISRLTILGSLAAAISAGCLRRPYQQQRLNSEFLLLIDTDFYMKS